MIYTTSDTCLSSNFVPTPVAVEDNCATHVFVTGHSNTGLYTVGPHQISLSVLDDLGVGGRYATCDFVLTVVDNIPPVMGKSLTFFFSWSA